MPQHAHGSHHGTSTVALTFQLLLPTYMRRGGQVLGGGGEPVVHCCTARRELSAQWHHPVNADPLRRPSFRAFGYRIVRGRPKQERLLSPNRVIEAIWSLRLSTRKSTCS